MPANTVLATTNNSEVGLANGVVIPANCALVMASATPYEFQVPYLSGEGTWSGPITLKGAGNDFGFVGAFTQFMQIL